MVFFSDFNGIFDDCCKNFKKALWIPLIRYQFVWASATFLTSIYIQHFTHYFFCNFVNISTNIINPLSANPIKCSNTFKQFVSNLQTNCLSVFDHFVKLAFKGLKIVHRTTNSSQNNQHISGLNVRLVSIGCNPSRQVNFRDFLKFIFLT